MARKQLTAVERAEIRTLFFTAGMTKPNIAAKTGYGISQIRRAIRDPVPAARSGRPPVLSAEQQQELVEFVTATKKNRGLSFLNISTSLFDGAFGEYAIRSTLRRLGFSRKNGLLCPPQPPKKKITDV
ncbi:hypothetical protein E4U52_007626 [Claviceps spartinae]|nr:hypothetical protein E4U52_007626 [Claviceps spartinae]